MDETLVHIDRSHPHTTILTVNRPSKRNALTVALMESLCEAVEETQKLAGQRAIILKGAGSVFCAGLDLIEAGDKALEERSSHYVGKLLKTIYECSLITIAALHGASMGGGAGLMCACDLTVAESGTVISFPETRRGMVAAQIMPYVMRLVPRRMLQELIFLGETIDVHRAYEIGLINKVVPLYSSMHEALKFVSSLLQSAPKATAHSKKFIHKLDFVDTEEAFDLALKLHREIRQSDEFYEGMQAFQEKRLPRWSH